MPQQTPVEGKPAIVVAITGWDIAPWIDRFRTADPARPVLSLADAENSWPARYYMFCWKPAPAVFQRSPAPLMICSAGAGVDHIFKADPPSGVPITRIVDPDLTGRMVEYVVLHCLYHLRRMDAAAVNQRSQAWRSRDFPAAREVTVGILGVGEMGQASARGLQALGFEVIGWGRNARAGLSFASYAGPAALDAFLSRTDILVSLLPSTPETRGLIDGAFLKKLRRNGAFGAPVFINAGRGDGANEAELTQALWDGTLRAASLDVFATEPLPSRSPFWSMENVVITPHNAADSTPDAVVTAVMEEIRRFEAGEAPKNPVDPARGY